jgi:hypothetical protein
MFIEKGEVIRITPESVPAFLKRLAIEFGTDFIVEGTADDGTYLAAKIIGGKLVEPKVRKGARESVIGADVEVSELDGDLFRDLPLNKKFRVKVEKLTR